MIFNCIQQHSRIDQLSLMHFDLLFVSQNKFNWTERDRRSLNRWEKRSKQTNISFSKKDIRVSFRKFLLITLCVLLWFFSLSFRLILNLKLILHYWYFFFLPFFPFFNLFKTVSVLKVLSQGFLAAFLFTSTLGENSWIKETLRKSICWTLLYPFHEITPQVLCMTYIIVIIYSVFFIASIFFLNFYSLRSCIACMRNTQ